MRIRHAAASDMAHSAACSTSASQSSPTCRSNAQTPHQLLSLPVSKKTTDAVLYHLHISCCRPPCTCTSHLICAVAWPLLKCWRRLWVMQIHTYNCLRFTWFTPKKLVLIWRHITIKWNYSQRYTKTSIVEEIYSYPREKERHISFLINEFRCYEAK